MLILLCLPGIAGIGLTEIEQDLNHRCRYWISPGNEIYLVFRENFCKFKHSIPEFREVTFSAWL